jgi:micrococcal nuclease
MILLLLFFNIAAWSSPCQHTIKNFACVKYVDNYDGDTLTFDIPNIHPYFGKNAKVRLHGIDAPELKPKDQTSPCELEWGRAAKRLVEVELKRAKRIDITNLKGRDKYGRILGQVVYDGKNLKEVLLKNHLAIPYDGKKKKNFNWCSLMEKKKNESKKL